jgi:hypothetical protein
VSVSRGKSEKMAGVYPDFLGVQVSSKSDGPV